MGIPPTDPNPFILAVKGIRGRRKDNMKFMGLSK
jgi:hypothetical protein